MEEVEEEEEEEEEEGMKASDWTPLQTERERTPYCSAVRMSGGSYYTLHSGLTVSHYASGRCSVQTMVTSNMTCFCS